MIKLNNCPFCNKSVHWCNCREDMCHIIVCDTCGTFDFNGDVKSNTVEELKISIAKIWNKSNILKE